MMTDGSGSDAPRSDRGLAVPADAVLGSPRAARVARAPNARPPVGDLHLATVVINVRDMRRAVEFWSAVLGYRPRESHSDPAFMMLIDPDNRGLPVSLQLGVGRSREPAPVHLDLYTDERARHVERLVGLGATVVDNWPYPAQADFVVLRDPDGNEFCVIDHAELDGPASSPTRLP